MDSKNNGLYIFRPKTSKILLIIFVVFCLFTISLKVIEGILLDLGYKNGSTHLGFWSAASKDNFLPLDKNDPYYYVSQDMLEHHPNTFWPLTQFTWITTVLITCFLIIKLLEINDITPKWLKWLMTQRALSLLTIYDSIVGVVYWAAVFYASGGAYNNDIAFLQLSSTIMVHALIPIAMVCYAFLFLFKSQLASKLEYRIFWKGIIYPTIYFMGYILLTFIWDDPYPVTNMHHLMVTEGPKAWAGELWKVFSVLGVVYFFIMFFILLHNIILLKFNKNYVFSHDYELIELQQNRINKKLARRARMTRKG